MKTIGMIGGMSWESTQIYYRMLNELTRRHLGGLHSASCIIHSVDFAPVEKMQSDGNWGEAGKLLASIAVNLEQAGADAIVITSNTMHKLAPEIGKACSLPLLHIGDAVAENVKKREIGRVALLGTRYTMEEPFMKERLEEHGLEVFTPDSNDRDLINHIIFQELCVGKVRDISRKRMLQVIEKLYDEGIHGIVLGCTELHMLVKQEELNLPLFDSTQLHVESIAEYMLEGVLAG
ncbi:aspartate/glutamate racemase family protein [Alteribacter natronophilus]|uniref:aspartate/glutamate racemase family protein n=1 Tax=Alteribacter natronophilus TaxID=2583810 RepID=UPI00110EF9CF|nr:aspartate/glutamate racemase family protein [Alteribacter natronophilus]TMW70298.1 aspartate/glutamate racemase family protein [Alteribacter natronophilus]